jgi:hypothetical protein
MPPGPAVASIGKAPYFLFNSVVFQEYHYKLIIASH